MGAPSCPLEAGSASYRSNIIYPGGGPGSYIIPYNPNVVAGFTTINSIFVRGFPLATDSIFYRVHYLSFIKTKLLFDPPGQL